MNDWYEEGDAQWRCSPSVSQNCSVIPTRNLNFREHKSTSCRKWLPAERAFLPGGFTALEANCLWLTLLTVGTREALLALAPLTHAGPAVPAADAALLRCWETPKISQKHLKGMAFHSLWNRIWMMGFVPPMLQISGVYSWRGFLEFSTIMMQLRTFNCIGNCTISMSYQKGLNENVNTTHTHVWTSFSL